MNSGNREANEGFNKVNTEQQSFLSEENVGIDHSNVSVDIEMQSSVQNNQELQEDEEATKLKTKYSSDICSIGDNQRGSKILNLYSQDQDHKDKDNADDCTNPAQEAPKRSGGPNMVFAETVIADAEIEAVMYNVGEAKKKPEPSYFDVPVSWWRRFMQCLGFQEKMLIRDSTSIIISTVLAFLKPIQDYFGFTTTLIFIYAMLMTLRPLANSSVGTVVDSCFMYAVCLCLGQLAALFCGGIFPHSGVGFALIYFLVAFSTTSIGSFYTRTQLPIMMMLIFLGSSLTEIFYIVNYTTGYSDKYWSVTVTQVSDTILTGMLSITVSMLCGFLIFPWKAETSLKTSLASLRHQRELLLKEINSEFLSMFSAILNGTEFDVDQTLADKAMKAQAADLIKSRGLLIHTMSETRFRFSGYGHEYVQHVKWSKPMHRILRDVYTRFRARTSTFSDEVGDIRSWVLQQDTMTVEAFDSLVQDISLLLVAMADNCRTFGQILVKSCRSFEGIDFSSFETTDFQKGNVERSLKRFIIAAGDLDCIPHDMGFFIVILARNLERLAEEQLDTLERKRLFVNDKALHSSWSFRFADFKRVSFDLNDLLLPKFAHGPLYRYSKARMAQELTWYQDIYHKVVYFVESEGCKSGFKAAMVATSLLSFGLAASTAQFFFFSSMANAMSSVFSVLRLMQFGLVFERVVLRVGGSALGYVWVSIVLQISISVTGGLDLLNQWFAFILGLVLLGLQIYVKIKHPLQSYFAYCAIREYYVIALSLFTSPPLTPPMSGAMWTFGAFVVMNVMVGSCMAFIVGTMVFPITGFSALRNRMGLAFHNMVFLVESIEYLRLVHAPIDSIEQRREKCDVLDVNLADRIYDIENYVEYIVFTLIPTFKRAIQMEPLNLRRHIHGKQIDRVIESTQNLWRIMWIFHRLLLDPERDLHIPRVHRANVKFQHVRLVYARLISEALYCIAMTLDRSVVMVSSPPLLRSIVMSQENTRQHIKALRGSARFRSLGDTSSLFVANFSLFEHLVIELSTYMCELYDFVELLLPRPPYAAILEKEVCDVRKTHFEHQNFPDEDEEEATVLEPRKAEETHEKKTV